MRPARFASLAAFTMGHVSVTIALPGQQRVSPRSVDVFVNDTYLLAAHALVSSNDLPVGIDQAYVAYHEIQRVLAGGHYLERSGKNLDIVMTGAGAGAALRAQRRGRISPRLHRTGDQDYIPLLDLVRALDAKILGNGDGGFNLKLNPERSRALLTVNTPRRRRL